MPKWLGPWLLPVAMLVGVVVAVTAQSAGVPYSALGYLVVALLLGGLLVHLRVRYLRAHPPDPELTHKPFWQP